MLDDIIEDLILASDGNVKKMEQIIKGKDVKYKTKEKTKKNTNVVKKDVFSQFKKDLQKRYNLSNKI